MLTVYTIGHSTYPYDYFLDLLMSHDINCVIDVRSMPYSKYAVNYNKDRIQLFLKSNQILYMFLGEELGARPADTNLYSKEGYLDFEKVSNSALFIGKITKWNLWPCLRNVIPK